MEYVLVGCRSLVALVFVVSLVGKLRGGWAYAEFVAATGRLAPRRVSPGGARRLATVVAAVEVAIVTLMLAPAATPIGFATATTLLLAFTGAILLALRRGERAPCRCFGSARHALGYPQVVRNLVLLSVCVLGLVGGQLSTTAPDPARALLAVVAGAVAATAVVMSDDIVALFGPV